MQQKNFQETAFNVTAANIAAAQHCLNHAHDGEEKRRVVQRFIEGFGVDYTKNVARLLEALGTLSSQEQRFLDSVCQKPFIISHYTNYREAILESCALLSPRKRRDQGKIPSNIHTVSYGDKDLYVYFIPGFNASKPPQGLADAEYRFYAPLLPDLFDKTDIFVIPLINHFLGNAALDITVFGGTHRIIHHFAETWEKKYLYIRPDGTRITRTRTFSDEVFCGGSILSGLALQWLLELRDIGGAYQEMVLNACDSPLLGEFFNAHFPYLEAIVPVSFDLNSPGAGWEERNLPANTTLLYDAVKNGDMHTVRRLIDEGVSIQEQFPHKRSLLVAAIVYEYTEIALYLIEQGVNLWQYDDLSQGRIYPLEMAVYCRDKAIFNRMLEKAVTPHPHVPHVSTTFSRSLMPAIIAAQETGKSDLIEPMLKLFDREAIPKIMISADFGVKTVAPAGATKRIIQTVAGVVVATNQSGHILVMGRNKNRMGKLNAHRFPGGGVDASDASIPEAAARECLEEIGVKPSQAQIQKAQKFTYDDSTRQHSFVIFDMRGDGHDVAMPPLYPGSDFAVAEWVPIKDLEADQTKPMAQRYSMGGEPVLTSNALIAKVLQRGTWNPAQDEIDAIHFALRMEYYGEQLMIDACVAGDMKTARQILEYGISMNACGTFAPKDCYNRQNPLQVTPLVVAAFLGDLKLLAFILKATPELETQHIQGVYPALLAAIRSTSPNRAEMVKALLDAGVNPNAWLAPSGENAGKHYDDTPPLVEVLSQLAMDDTLDPILTKMAKDLLEKGADVTAIQDGNGYTALFLALEVAKKESVRKSADDTKTMEEVIQLILAGKPPVTYAWESYWEKGVPRKVNCAEQARHTRNPSIILATARMAALQEAQEKLKGGINALAQVLEEIWPEAEPEEKHAQIGDVVQNMLQKIEEQGSPSDALVLSLQGTPLEGGCINHNKITTCIKQLEKNFLIFYSGNPLREAIKQKPPKQTRKKNPVGAGLG